MTIRLYDNDSGMDLGSISREQLRFLIDHLEEESPEDRDYFLNPDTLVMLERRGADVELLALLRQAMAGKEGLEIRWKERG